MPVLSLGKSWHTVCGPAKVLEASYVPDLASESYSVLDVDAIIISTSLEFFIDISYTAVGDYGCMTNVKDCIKIPFLLPAPPLQVASHFSPHPGSVVGNSYGYSCFFKAT